MPVFSPVPGHTWGPCTYWRSGSSGPSTRWWAGQSSGRRPEPPLLTLGCFGTTGWMWVTLWNFNPLHLSQVISHKNDSNCHLSNWYTARTVLKWGQVKQWVNVAYLLIQARIR